MILYPAIATLVMIWVAGSRTSRTCLFILTLTTMLIGVLTLHVLVVGVGLVGLITGLILNQHELSVKRRFAIIVGVLSVAWTPPTWSALSRYQQIARLVDVHPYVSLADRVATKVPPVVIEKPAPVSQAVLDTRQTNQRQWQVRSTMWGGRTRAIRALHRSATSHFLNAPEFGIARMFYPNFKQLEKEQQPPVLLSQLVAAEEQSSRSPATNLSHEIGKTVDQVLPQVVDRMAVHHENISHWFVDPQSVGHIEDVDRVAGFQPHSISGQTAWSFNWNDSISSIAHAFMLGTNYGTEAAYPVDFRLVSIQLVGLLYHQQPVVYDIDTVPSLDGIEDAPTRPLDGFESAALARLIKGEAIVVDRSGEEVRVFGGLRNAKSCTECHNGPMNQLLGAFSYRLQPYANE